DHEQEEIHARRPRDHRAHEALVSGDVDDGQAVAVRELERRVAEVDRDPALALLRQAVRVLAGQRLHERRLAVVDVAGGRDGEGHARTLPRPGLSTQDVPLQPGTEPVAERDTYRCQAREHGRPSHVPVTVTWTWPFGT